MSGLPGEKVFISTYGCQMNDHDTERMYAILESQRFLQAVSPADADVIIINSCSVREKPVHKVMSEIGTYRGLKSQNPKLKLGVGGCVGQQEGQRLLEKSDLLDFVFGTDTIDQLPEIIDDVRQRRKRVVSTRIQHKAPYSIETMIRQRPISSAPVTAHVTITKGCDNFCSFCIVPFTRGRERSRLLHEIVHDVQSLVARGVREVTLLGQNVNSYKSPDQAGGFADLLRAVCQETDVVRVRYTTSHPKDLNDDVIQVHVRHESKLGLYLHLPVQSGSDVVLERMNRGYTVENYLAKVNRLRNALPSIALSTDVIVGFPGESQDDFKKTLELLRAVEYENVYGFKYSPRPFTKALKYDDQIPEMVKDERLQALITQQDALGPAIASKYDQMTYPVLVEGPSKSNPLTLTGRTPHFKVVNFAGGSELIGQLVPVKVIKSQPFALRGEVQL